MAKSKKVVIGIIVAVFVVLGVGLLILAMSPARYEAAGRMFVGNLEYSLGRKVTLKNVDGSLTSGINAYQVKIAPPGGDLNKPEMSIDRMELSYRLLPMLFGKTIVTRMEIHDFTARVTRKAGRLSYQDIIEHMQKLMAEAAARARAELKDTGTDGRQLARRHTVQQNPVAAIFTPATAHAAGYSTTGNPSSASGSSQQPEELEPAIEIHDIRLYNGTVIFSDDVFFPGQEMVFKEVSGSVISHDGFFDSDTEVKGKMTAPLVADISAKARMKPDNGPSMEMKARVPDVTSLNQAMTAFKSMLQPEAGTLDLTVSMSSKQGILTSVMDFSVSDLTVVLPAMFGLRLTGISASGNFGDAGLELKSLDLPLGAAGSLKAKGTVLNFADPKISGTWTSDELKAGPLMDYMSTFSAMKDKMAAFKGFNPGGAVVINGSYDGGLPDLEKFKLPEIGLSADLKSASFDVPGFGERLTDLTGTIALNGLAFEGGNLTGKLGSIPIQAATKISIIPPMFGMPASISMTTDVTVPGTTTAQELLKVMPADVRKKLETSTVTGTVKVDKFTIKGGMDRMTMNGGLTLSGGTFQMKPYLIKPLTGLTAKATLDGTITPALAGTVSIHSLSAKAGSSLIEARGAIKDFTALKLNMTAGMKKLSLKDVSSHVDMPETMALDGTLGVTSAITGTMASPVINGKVTGGQGTVTLISEGVESLKIRFTNLTADYAMKDMILKVPSFRASTFQGNMTGNSSFDFSKSPIEYETKIKGKGIDLGAFSEDNLGWLFALSGKGHLAADIKGTGNDLKAMLGSGDLKLENTNFSKMPGLRKFLSTLDVPWIAEKAYENITGSFALDRGRIKTSDLTARGDNIQITGNGSVGFDSTIQADVGISLAQAGLKGTKLEKVAKKIAGRRPLVFKLGLSGPVTDLKFSTDLGGLMKQAITTKLLDKLFGKDDEPEEAPADSPAETTTKTGEQPASGDQTGDKTQTGDQTKEPEEEKDIEDVLEDQGKELLKDLFGF